MTHAERPDSLLSRDAAINFNGPAEDAIPSRISQNPSSPRGEHAEAALGRRQFFGKGAGIVGSAVVGATVLANLTSEADAQVPAGPKSQMQLVRRHENDHVAFLVGALGSMARPKPTFQNLQQPNLASFLGLALALENTGVGAYLGAVPAILNPTILAQAGSIALVEARHAGFFNSLRSRAMTTNLFGQELSFERAFTVDEVLAAAGPYLASLNGGPSLSFSATPSPSNDIAILNFALALEYLEADYYNINVPIFYGP